MSPQHKATINPGLLAALKFFASHPLSKDMTQQVLFVYEHPAVGKHPPMRESWTFERAAGMALTLLETDDLAILKFRALVDGLGRYGMDVYYERIMGEPLAKAMDTFK